MVLLVFVALGFAFSTLVGVIRIIQNNLVGEERIIYFLLSSVSGAGTILYFLRVFDVINDLELLAIQRPGIPFLIAGLILIMLFYRKSKNPGNFF